MWQILKHHWYDFHLMGRFEDYFKWSVRITPFDPLPLVGFAFEIGGDFLVDPQTGFKRFVERKPYRKRFSGFFGDLFGVDERLIGRGDGTEGFEVELFEGVVRVSIESQQVPVPVEKCQTEGSIPRLPKPRKLSLKLSVWQYSKIVAYMNGSWRSHEWSKFYKSILYIFKL